MLRIGIDARKLADYGIGTYLQGLLAEYAGLPEPPEVVLFLRRGMETLLPEMPENWRLVEVEAPGYSAREQLTVPLAALRARLDVLHVPHYVIPLLYPFRMVVTVHDIIHVLFPEFLPNALSFAYARMAIRAAVRRARVLVAVSETTADDLVRLFGAVRERLRVIPHGVHGEFLATGEAVSDERRRERFGLRPPYLLHVGNHKPHKNAEGLLKAYQLLAQRSRPQVPPLVLVGGFSPDGEMARRSRAMGLGDRVRCIGHVEREELAALYRGASAFVYPTLYEGFGLPILEAMACGVPVVAGDAPAVREVAQDAVVRVNPRDVVELAAAIRRVLEQPELRAQLAAAGRARAHEYSWQRAAAATLAAYHAAAEAA
jgi:glycosyltransferase involved in cell wall biosynthesis